MISVSAIIRGVAAAADVPAIIVRLPFPESHRSTEARARVAWLALTLAERDAREIGEAMACPAGAVIRMAKEVDLRMAADTAYRREIEALERAIIASVAVAGQLAASLDTDRDALAIASFALSSRRAATDLAVEEIEALARAVVAGATSAEPTPVTTIEMEAAHGQD